MRRLLYSWASLCLVMSTGWLQADLTGKASTGSRHVPEVPEIFATGVISTAAYEFGITFSPDGREAFFTRRSGCQSNDPRIYVGRFEGGRWTTPVRAHFSTDDFEMLPQFSPDGQTIVFYSERKKGGNGGPPGNLWLTRRQGRSWSAPELLTGHANRSPFTMMVSMAEGNKLYYTTVLQAERGLFCSELNGDAAAFLPERINRLGPAHAFVSPDGETMLFDARLRGPRISDLYLSRKRAGEWSEPVKLGLDINRTGTEFSPCLSPDGSALYFSRTVDGNGDIWWVDAEL